MECDILSVDEKGRKVTYVMVDLDWFVKTYPNKPVTITRRYSQEEIDYHRRQIEIWGCE